MKRKNINDNNKSKRKKIDIIDVNSLQINEFDEEDRNWFYNYIKMYNNAENIIIKMEIQEQIYNKYKFLKDIYTKHKKEYNNIKNEIEQREILMSDIFELGLTDDDNIWFYEQIELYNNTNNTTEEKIELRNKIYNKYNNMKNIDNKRLEDINKVNMMNIVNNILNSNYTNDIKNILYRKYKTYCENQITTSEEYIKTLEWINMILRLPTINEVKQLNINETIHKLKITLDNEIYGLQNVKERIMEAMCSKLLNKNNKGKILALIGPPGVGKTLIASIIAKSLEIPFSSIACNTITDPAMLIGHSQTYITSTPGIFMKILINTQRLDSLILLDEFGEIPNDIVRNIFLNILDNNNTFYDMYAPEIKLILEFIFFILTANNLNKIDKALLSRIEPINIEGYKLNEKINIVKQFELPKIKKQLDLDINITDENIKYLIENKTEMENGMRYINKILIKLCEKIALLKNVKNIEMSYKIDNLKFPLSITKKIIDEL